MIVDGGVTAVPMSGAAMAYRSKIDRTAATLVLTPRPPVPGSAPGRAMSFHFVQPDPERLELRSADHAIVVMRLRRVDPSTSPLVA
jgi:hypothetical protein